jgi:serine protease Do
MGTNRLDSEQSDRDLKREADQVAAQYDRSDIAEPIAKVEPGHESGGARTTETGGPCSELDSPASAEAKVPSAIGHTSNSRELESPAAAPDLQHVRGAGAKVDWPQADTSASGPISCDEPSPVEPNPSVAAEPGLDDGTRAGAGTWASGSSMGLEPSNSGWVDMEGLHSSALGEIRTVSASQNVHAAGLGVDSAGWPTPSSVAHDSLDSNASVGTRRTNPRSSNSADVWKSLLWLASMIVVFLGAISYGPQLIERFQYAAARGKMRAQYEAATDLLSNVSLRDSSMTSELVVHRIRPSVVSIQANTSAPIGRRMRQVLRGQGSGVVVDESGYVVTNNHVIDNASEIVVILSDRREYTATVVGRDSETDLAVLKIDATDLIAAEWGDSDGLELGSAVWAMGSPYGLEQTVTRGIISGKHRRTADDRGLANPHQDLLQTDAAINPGNSGGPLVNSLGQVIGINTSIFGDTFQGISFAVPSSLAKAIVEKLIKHGEVKRGFLGIVPEDVTHRHAVRLSLPEISGAIVATVEDGTPAFEAGLRTEDVIVRFSDFDIDNHVMLFRAIGLTPPGTPCKVSYYRDGILQETTVVVSEVMRRRR